MKLIDKIKPKNKTNVLNILFILGLALAVYGFVQEYFDVQPCKTYDCEMIRTIIKLDPALLYLVASLFFITLLLINNIKTFNILKKYLDLIFFSGVIFQTVLFFDAFFIYSLFCKECVIMISLLFIIGVIMDYKKMILPLAVISAIYLLDPIPQTITSTSDNEKSEQTTTTKNAFSTESADNNTLFGLDGGIDSQECGESLEDENGVCTVE